ncbi:MAG: nuclear transport factor 2 family protein [Myxococcota bacterium]|nr:nuclear transport factor 2 family protein [Myxococcota bacterium]
MNPRLAIHAALDAFHRAAAEADADAYFDLLTPDAVFIGTDATERWSRSELKAYAEPHFAGDSAWIYTPVARSLTVAGEFAWFDERLSHAKYGETRGSGVLQRIGSSWRIRQYVLSFSVPNAAAGEVVEAIARVEK